MLEFNVENQIIKRIDSFLPVADSRNYLKAEFKMTEEWQGAITAVFGYGGSYFRVLLDGDNCCTVPWEVIKAPHFTVSLFCGDESLITANSIDVLVEPSGMKEGAEPLEPTPEIWQQYMSKMQQNIENAVPYIGENGNWYFYNAELGEYEDSGMLAAPEKGTDYWTDEDKAEIKEEVEPLVVNFEVAADGTVTPDTETLDSISDAYLAGRPILANVTYSPGSGEITFPEKEVQVLTLVNIENTGAKPMFANIERVDANTCQATYLWNEGEVYSFVTDETIEIWKIKTVSLPSKDYVDNQIEKTKTFVINAYIAEDETYTADKTYYEMIEAYEEGKELVVKIYLDVEEQAYRILRLDAFSSGTFIFALGLGGQFDFAKVYVDESGVSVRQYSLVQDMSEVQTQDAPPSALAVANYVDNQIGDIETALDNIIIKYGLGGGDV